MTININGLSLIHQDSNGASTATLPNVCHTPSAGPTPYPSVALSRDLAGGTETVRVDGGHSAATARSVFATSAGDEPGVGGGVVSGVRGAESSFLTWSPDVRIEGSPAGRLTDKMLNNHGNTVNAGGASNDPVAKGQRKAKANEADKVEVTAVDLAGHRVHVPYTVVLKPISKKGPTRSAVARTPGKPATFRFVPKKVNYRVMVIHDCYPEGFAEVTVDQRVEKVEVKLARVKLRDVADHIRHVRLGVRFSSMMTDQYIAAFEQEKVQHPDRAAALDGKIAEQRAGAKREPPHWTSAKAQFHDVVVATFWSNFQERQTTPGDHTTWTDAIDGNGNNVNSWIFAPAQQAVAHGMGIEATTLLWFYGFQGDKVIAWKRKRLKAKKGQSKPRYKYEQVAKAIPWSPNPQIAALKKDPPDPNAPPDPNDIRNIADGATAMTVVKNFITRVVAGFKSVGAFDAVKRWVVINEPMNILLRDVTRTAPFLNALLPTDEDKSYAKKQVARVEKHARPTMRKLTDQAIINMVEILKHAHLTIANGSLLIVNDYGIEGYNEKHGLDGRRALWFREMMTKIVARLKAEAPDVVPRLRIGLQAHLKSGGELGGDTKPGADAGSREEAGGERNDFSTSAVRKQMDWYKRNGFRICVTEADLLLPKVSYEVKRKGQREKESREGLKEHIKQGTVKVKNAKGKEVTIKKDSFDAHGFFNKKVRKRPYLEAFAQQRIEQRDLVAAILGQGIVDSFVCWDFDDDLPDDVGGSNFRYHGYMWHEHLACKFCQNDPLVKQPDDHGHTYYAKPNYWGTVAAFILPGSTNYPAIPKSAKAKSAR